jgi:hypothetical protein
VVRRGFGRFATFGAAALATLARSFGHFASPGAAGLARTSDDGEFLLLESGHQHFHPC